MAKSRRLRSQSVGQSKVVVESTHFTTPSVDLYKDNISKGIVDVKPDKSDYSYFTPNGSIHKPYASYLDITPTEDLSAEVPKKKKYSNESKLFILKSWRWRRGTLLIIPMLVAVSLYIFLIVFSLDEVNDELIKTNFRSPVTEQVKVKVEMRVIKINLLENTFNARVYFYPTTQIAKSWSRLDVPVHVDMKFLSANYAANATMEPIDAVFPILGGGHYYYPFDNFKADIFLLIVNQDTNELFPLEVQVFLSTPSLWIDIVRRPFPNNFKHEEISQTSSSVNMAMRTFRLELQISRPDFVIFFSLFVAFMMWGLSLAILHVTLNLTLLSPLRPDVGYLALGPALLFALPSLRESQPGVPPIGILMDVVGFFWYLFFTSSLLILLGIWLFPPEAQL